MGCGGRGQIFGTFLQPCFIDVLYLVIFGLTYRTWEEPFDQAIYCLATDGNWTLVCGTARHGMVRLWDMRHSKPVQMFYVKHPFSGQSSPVYSVAFDQKNLYVALDQCVNLLSFSGYKETKSNINSYNDRLQLRGIVY